MTRPTEAGPSTVSTNTTTTSLPPLLTQSSTTWITTDPNQISKVSPEKLIRTYEGLSDPEKWLETVKSAAQIGHWPEDYAVLIARSKLSGKALRFLDYCVPVGTTLTMSELSSYLISEYKPKEKLIVRLTRFVRCVQEPDEGLTAFAARTRSLGLNTCDNDQEKACVEPRLMAQFVNGLRRKDIYEYVSGRDPKTLAEALQFALDSEAQSRASSGRHMPVASLSFRPTGRPRNQDVAGNRNPSRQVPNSPGRRRRTPTPPFRRNRSLSVHFAQGNGTPPNGPRNRVTCTWCETHNPTSKSGHTRGECRQRLRAENKCFLCKREGHFRQNCPFGTRNPPVNSVHSDCLTPSENEIVPLTLIQ